MMMGREIWIALRVSYGNVSFGSQRHSITLPRSDGLSLRAVVTKELLVSLTNDLKVHEKGPNPKAQPLPLSPNVDHAAR